MGERFKIWGVTYRRIQSGDRLFWEILDLDNPFMMQDHKYRISLGEKAVRMAQKEGATKFLWKGRMFDVPNDKILRQKIKNKHYEMKPSLFKDGSPMRLLYFVIS